MAASAILCLLCPAGLVLQGVPCMLSLSCLLLVHSCKA